MQIRENLSSFFDDRAPNAVIDTLVIHSMFNPDSASPLDVQACVDILNQHEVSAHYLIAVDGSVWRLVPDEKRAWHAGVSRMHDGREWVNHFSIGVELLNNAREKFTSAQYQSLAELAAGLKASLPLRFVVGHEDIAPGRKNDPGAFFDWDYLKLLLAANTATAALEFPFS